MGRLRIQECQDCRVEGFAVVGCKEGPYSRFFRVCFEKTPIFWRENMV